MGWERRKGRLYYYRKERRGDRVVSEYAGALAQACAALDTATREKRERAAGYEKAAGP